MLMMTAVLYVFLGFVIGLNWKGTGSGPDSIDDNEPLVRGYRVGGDLFNGPKKQ